MAGKKMDRSTIIVIVICVILLFSWNKIFGPSGLNWIQAPKKPAKTQTVEKNIKQQPVEKSAAATVVQSEKQVTALQAAKPDDNIKLPGVKKWTGKFPNIELSSPESLSKITINPIKGNIASITLKNYNDSTKTKKIILNQNIIPGALSVFGEKNNWKLLTVFAPTTVGKSSATVKREFCNAKGVKFLLTQKWSLGKSYVINYTVTINNPNDKVLKFRALNIWIGGIPPVKYLTGDYNTSGYRGGRESHRIDVLLASTNELKSVKSSNKTLDGDMIQHEPIKWLAISDKYFAYILKQVPGDKVFNYGNVNHKDTQSMQIGDKTTKYAIISAAGRIGNINIPSNNKKIWNFEYYAGPKDVMQLKAFDPQTTDIMHLAFLFLNTISLWLLYCLIFLNSIVGNYGLAIILLTVIVKLIFWPITHKANVSMKKMQKIQPLVKELRKEYKEDKQKLNAKTMELYKKEKVNPLGGCLPILVQLPVFFALYWTLNGAIELRHASFLWINDLTRPDTIGYILGLPINPLAIAMALTMVFQQKLTPTATDPAQAKMMMLMPVIMLFFLYSMPSGLTLYWTVSQLISIVQLLMNKYSVKKENLKTA